MNAAHLHLLITHIPMLGPLFGLCLLVAGRLARKRELHEASLWTFLIASLSAIPTYLSGRPASALLTHLMPGVPMDIGEQHAEVAIIALCGALGLGAFALLGLILFRKSRPVSGWFGVLAILLASATTALMIWTATLGGQIRHPEIRGPAQTATFPTTRA